MQFTVYKILNLKNNRVYIGSTVDFEIRKAEHLGQLRSNKHINRFLQSDFNIYGEENFSFSLSPWPHIIESPITNICRGDASLG